MLEKEVEKRLSVLKSTGFEVLKLKTPGHNGVPDRLILRPRYCPGPPSFVEIKRPGKSERALQAAVRDDWRTRGVIVHPMCDTIEKVDQLVADLMRECNAEYLKGTGGIDGSSSHNLI